MEIARKVCYLKELFTHFFVIHIILTSQPYYPALSGAWNVKSLYELIVLDLVTFIEKLLLDFCRPFENPETEIYILTPAALGFRCS